MRFVFVALAIMGTIGAISLVAQLQLNVPEAVRIESRKVELIRVQIRVAAVWPDNVFEHEFHREPEREQESVVEPPAAPLTIRKAPVSLEGTVVDNDPERSAAIFRSAAGRQFVVTIHSALPAPDSDWILEDVQTTHVVLSTGEIKETLQLKRPAGR